MVTPFLSSPVLIMDGLLRVTAGGSTSSDVTRVPAGSRCWMVIDRSRRPVTAGTRLVAESGPDDDHLAGKLRQALDLAAFGVQQHEILDPDARLAVQIDAGLHGKHRRARQRVVRGPLSEGWRFVRREPDPMPGSVPEMRSVAGGGDDVAGDAVDGPPGR